MAVTKGKAYISNRPNHLESQNKEWLVKAVVFKVKDCKFFTNIGADPVPTEVYGS